LFNAQKVNAAGTTAPPFLPFQAQLTDAADAPITGAVSIQVQIIDNAISNCIYFDQTLGAVADSKGLVFLSLGKSGGTVAAPFSNISQIFENVLFVTCLAGSTTGAYTPVASESRMIRFNVGGAGFSAAMDIGSVMFSHYANLALNSENAYKINGVTVNAPAPSGGQVLTFSAGQWIAAAGGGGGITALGGGGDVTATGPGSVAATVVTVGSVSAANVASGANLANAATDASTNGTIVKRHGTTGNFSTSGTITAATFSGNLSGTATTATSVTTNADLTGPITSTGNATSIASQTGTGSTFVMNTSPTLVTPIIGAATGTSLSVSGSLTSTVATGTAPLVVSSTTQVANLNAATAGTAGNVTGVVAVANGGTGSSTQNFVDLTTTQTIGGNKTFNGATTISGTNTFATGSGAVSLNGNTTIAAGKNLTVGNIEYLGITTGSAPAVSIASTGRIYYNSTDQKFKVSQNNGAYVDLVGGGGGITSLGGLTSATQTLSVGTSGIVLNWSTAGSDHALNIPLASAATVTAGLISKAEFDGFNAKIDKASTFTTGSIPFASGGNQLNQNNANLFWDNTNNRLGIGTSSPTARLHLPAGTINANTAPLKFVSGPIMTATQMGAVEFDGTDFFLTINNGTRSRVVTGAAGAGSFLMTDGANNMTNAINAFDGNTGQPGFTFSGDTDTGISHPAGNSNTLSFSTNGVERLKINGDGNIGIGLINPNSPFEVQSTNANTGNTIESGVYTNLIVSPTADTAANASRTSLTAETSVGNGNSVQYLKGIFTSAQQSQNGTFTEIQGINASAMHTGLGNGSNIIGANIYANSSAGAVTNIIGTNNSVNSSGGSVTTLVGQQSILQVSGAGTVTNLIGNYIKENISSGTVTNRYSLYIDMPTGNSVIADDFALYQMGGSRKNYFAGNVGIGTTPSGGDKLQVLGNVVSTGQIRSGYLNAGTFAATSMALDMNQGNTHELVRTSNTGNVTITLNNTAPGGTYTVLVQNTSGNAFQSDFAIGGTTIFYSPINSNIPNGVKRLFRITPMGGSKAYITSSDF